MMEMIYKIIMGSVSGGFWHFAGCWFIIVFSLAIPAKIFILTINRTLRHWSLLKLGYPPKHCDADGDAIMVIENEEDENRAA